MSAAIQKELFNNKLMYKDVGKRTDYPAVADLDYSEQVSARMKKELACHRKPQVAHVM